MIPGRILQIAKTVVITTLVMAFCFYAYSPGMAIAFGATSFWMLGNLLLLAGVMRIALGTEENKSLGMFMLFGTLKLVWLAGGIIAIQKIGVSTKLESLGIILGVGSVLFVVIMKALGYKMSQSLAVAPAGDDEKKVAKV